MTQSAGYETRVDMNREQGEAGYPNRVLEDGQREDEQDEQDLASTTVQKHTPGN